MKSEDLKYLFQKRIQVLNYIKPILEYFEIDNYDYLLLDDLPLDIFKIEDNYKDYKDIVEVLKIGGTFINCSCNSIYEIINEILNYLVCKREVISQKQTLKLLQQHWLMDNGTYLNKED